MVKSVKPLNNQLDGFNYLKKKKVIHFRKTRVKDYIYECRKGLPGITNDQLKTRIAKY